VKFRTVGLDGVTPALKAARIAQWGIRTRQGERTVEVLAQRTGLSVANASQHLQHLRRAGLLKSRRQGKFVYYTLADDGILDVLTALRRIAERNVAEVERVVRSYFNKLDDASSS
jgi:DNA-binding transcriptional ArsR family regulator